MYYVFTPSYWQNYNRILVLSGQPLARDVFPPGFRSLEFKDAVVQLSKSLPADSPPVIYAEFSYNEQQARDPYLACHGSASVVKPHGTRSREEVDSVPLSCRIHKFGDEELQGELSLFQFRGDMRLSAQFNVNPSGN